MMGAAAVLENPNSITRPISPFRELGAYEALWTEQGSSFRSIAERFGQRPGSVPSDFVPEDEALRFATTVRQTLLKAGVERFGVRVHGAGDYPERLRIAEYPVELLYFQGWWDLAESPSVAVVGTREPSEEGKARARRLVKRLIEDDFTVVAGLAKGIDTEVHRTAIELGGRTIAVIGTPLNLRYPKETSGTLVQARHALKQSRKLFILDSNFKNPALTWPAKFEEQGAIRVREYEDIREHLGSATL